MLCDTAKPNAAHLKLAELEEAGKLKAVITQNIDNLHQMAGSKKVLELHGSVYRNHCMRCGNLSICIYETQYGSTTLRVWRNDQTGCGTL